VSSLNVAVVLTLITGFGGAVAGAFVFNAPWWSWLPMGIVGLLGAIGQNQLRVRFLEKTNEDGKLSFPRLAGQLVLPFLAVIVVTAATVSGSIWLTRTIWPEEAANPRSLGRLEEGL
jgi:multidrug efflux pump subunit AcrB